jgi:hypothetical protein
MDNVASAPHIIDVIMANSNKVLVLVFIEFSILESPEEVIPPPASNTSTYTYIIAGFPRKWMILANYLKNILKKMKLFWLEYRLTK